MIVFGLIVFALIAIAIRQKSTTKKGKALRKQLYYLRVNHPGKTEAWYWHQAQKLVTQKTNRNR